MHFSTYDDYSDYLFSRKAENENISKACDLLARSDKNINKVINDAGLSPQEYIEVIALRRREGYSQSAGNGNVSAGNQTDKMYGNTPWKFIEEFLQNADDCKYADNPEIQITIDEQSGKIEFAYNEEGFTRGDIWALTAFEQSTKSNENDSLLDIVEEGVFFREKTGRKGIGFKSVFSLSADNVRVHIRSNQYSFCLDNLIGRIIPIWENELPNDKKTHIIVELENPHFALSDIYPNFKKVFCVEDTKLVFQKSPFLFMHHLKNIQVIHVANDGEPESFSILINHDLSLDRYEEPFNPVGIILAGIKHHGQYYRKVYSFLSISIHASSADEIAISCVRETQMVDLDSKFRNIAIIAPVLTGENNSSWKTGSLFRTFPMIDNTFSLPVSIDAPFELNSSRKGIEYTNLHGERTFNEKIIDLVFGNQGLFVDFFLFLRTVQSIHIDRYFSRKANTTTLFLNDANKDDNGKRVISEINLASEIYSGSSILTYSDVLDLSFSQSINQYLSALEEKYGIENSQYLSFIEKDLYPYLQSRQKRLEDTGSFEDLKVFLSCVKEQEACKVVRETCREGEWFYYNKEDNLSFWKYRIVESSPVSLAPMLNVLQNKGGLKPLEEVFGAEVITKSVNDYSEWSDIKKFLEAAIYYGFNTSELKIEALKKYAVPEDVDTKSDNLLRKAGIVITIPMKDIRELENLYGGTEQVVNALYQYGLRNYKALGTSRKNKSIELYQDSILLLQSHVEDCSYQYAQLITNLLPKKAKHIVFSYEDFLLCPIETKLLFMRRKECIQIGDYREICDAILEDEVIWDSSSNEHSEMLIRACMDANNPNLHKKYRDKNVYISMQYLVENNLQKLVLEVLVNHKFGQLRISNNGFFEEISIDDIRTKVAILAPAKIETLQKEGQHFYKGDLSGLPEDNRYLIDGAGKEVYLHCSDTGAYDDALAQYLNTSFDMTAARYMEDIRSQNQKVYTNYIKLALDKANANLDETFKIVKRSFPDITKEEYIQILSWFRMQSYSEALGNASVNSEEEIEKEIERDYKDSPWNFVYEFIQNVDDCTYPVGTSPVLGIEINETDCSVTFNYNETGFTPADIEALTSFDKSTKVGKLDSLPQKDGVFYRERTGRMGRGFKSVFALPGKDVSVHILSNGYSFRLRKRVGTIIPEWVQVDQNNSGSTKIRVEGFREDKIGGIYDKLRRWFSVDNTQDFFAKCPLLYLRNLRNVLVKDGTQWFSIEISTKKSKYSEEVIDIGNAKIVSGISYHGHFCKGCKQTQRIRIQENGRQTIDVNAIKYTLMSVLDHETRTVSCATPIILETSETTFGKGTLFRTLPLTGNTFGEVPLALNGPFITDDGRIKIRDDSTNQPIAEMLIGAAIPSLFEHIRSVEGIQIESYIPGWGQHLFMGYQNLNEIDLKSIIRQQPILELYCSNGFISPENARVMPLECYSWPYPEVLANYFFPEAENYLVDKKYIGKRFSIGKISFIRSDFVECLNDYIDEIERRDPDLLCEVLKENIFPFITNHYDELSKVYRSEKTVDELKKLRIFLFDMADGTQVVETAENDTIWVWDCPTQYTSYGKYRSLDHSPVDYTGDQLKWMRELHGIRSFSDAFQKDDFEPKSIGTWEEASKMIETLLYYDLDSQLKFKIPFLNRCLLDEDFDHSENVFREAYLENHSGNIASFFIDKEDIQTIYTRICNVSPRPIEQIGEFIIKLGARTGENLFKQSKESSGNLNCCEELLAVFQEYCRTREKAERVISLVQKHLQDKQERKFVRLVIEYEDVKNCSPEFISCIFRSNLLDDMDMKRLAQDYYNADNDLIGDKPDYVAALLLAAALVDKPQNIVKERELTVRLSDVYTLKLGTCIQNVMRMHDKKIGLQIIPDSDHLINPYSGDRISKALSWLDDSKEEKGDISRAYNYFTADVHAAFSESADDRKIYLIDSGKVILNQSTADASLLAFVRNQYKNKDSEFRTLIEIIQEQDLIKHWKGSKRQYVEKLASFRNKTRSIGKILYPDFTDSINNATENATEYIIPELLQNINDCTLSSPDCSRQLSIAIDNPAGTMTLTYEEDGFDYANVYSITALGQSSKHDKREGEKGLGFKKVFSLFDKVEIFSNGFFFSLTKEAPTVPNWISRAETLVDTKSPATTMVFYTKDKNRLRRVVEQWKEIFHPPYIETTVSPLFLDNIDNYDLMIDGEEHFSISREEILKGYYLLKKPILATYESLFPNDTSELEKQTIIENIKNELRKRVKCSVMTEEEFQEYVESISITICFPKKMQGRIQGYYYSTLPTTQSTKSALAINLPLELSTGRNGILQDSDFNHCIMELVYQKRNHPLSVYGLMLQEAAENMPDNEIFEYIKDDITEWIDKFCKKEPTAKEQLIEEVSEWNIFHSYPDNALVSISDSFSVDSIIYQYLASGIDNTEDFLKWCQKYRQEFYWLNMIYFKKNIVKTTEALEGFVKDLRKRQEYYPVSKKYNLIVYDYFCEEYEEVGKS